MYGSDKLLSWWDEMSWCAICRAARQAFVGRGKNDHRTGPVLDRQRSPKRHAYSNFTAPTSCSVPGRKMWDQNGACTTHGCVPEKAENIQQTADNATSLTSLSGFYSHTCVNLSRVAIHALQGWKLGLEQHFRATESFGANSDDVSVWELVVLGLEQHFRTTEAFGSNSDDVSVWELVGLGLEQHFRATEAFSTDSGGVSVWELVSLGLEQPFRTTEAFRTNGEDVFVLGWNNTSTRNGSVWRQ